MNELKVSVIIPFRNILPVTKDCISSVLNQNYKNIEVITISDREDNIYERSELNIISTTTQENKNIKHIYMKGDFGPGEKRNAGAKVATGDILFFLDSDCIMLPDTIENLIRVFKATNADAVSGEPLAPRKGNLLCYITGLEYEYRFEQMGEKFVSIAATTCFAVKHDIFKKIGGFEDYTSGEATGEDWDFSKNLTSGGFRLFHTNKVQVIHEHGSDTLMKFLYRHYMHARYRPVHYKKHKQGFDEYMTLSLFIKTFILLAIPQTISIIIKKKEPKILLLPFISILRNISWIIGLIIGSIRG
jgi:GT2 family glycosyltransferase